MQKIILLLTLVALLQAEEYGDTLKLRLGGYLIAANSTNISATSKYLIGTNINLQDDLGISNKTNSLRLDGYYRLNNSHKIEVATYYIHSNGTKSIDKDIELPIGGGDTIVFQAGATLNSKFNIDIYKLNYAYSFYHNDDVELSLAAGLHVMHIQTNLSGNASLNDETSESFQTENIEILAPLPVIGFRLDYRVTENFHMRGSLDYFSLNTEEFSGSFTDFLVAGEYQFFDNFGAGFGFNSTALNLKLKTLNGGKLQVNQQIGGAIAYLSYNY